MDDLTLARAIHVVSIIIWIGGVYMVTMIVLPLVHQQSALDDKIRIFQGIEKRFGAHARVVVLAAGVSGFYMVYALDAWDRYSTQGYWWMHAMTIIWALFTLALFILEPFVLHKWFHNRVQKQPGSSFRLVGRVHYILLAASIITVIGAIYGVHG